MKTRLPENEKIRLDKYLWSIRIFKTRTAAAEAADKGKVKLLEQAIKPSRAVKIGDVYDVKSDTKHWLIRVTGIIQNRVAYTEAIKFYEDITPENYNVPNDFIASAFHTGKRQSKIGRPTKKQMRAIGEFLNQSNE